VCLSKDFVQTHVLRCKLELFDSLDQRTTLLSGLEILVSFSHRQRFRICVNVVYKLMMQQKPALEHVFSEVLVLVSYSIIVKPSV